LGGDAADWQSQIRASWNGAHPADEAPEITRIIVGFAESTPNGLARLPSLPRKIMKEGIHPEYREVLFVDLSNGFKFVTRSCVSAKETAEHEGKTYPLFKLDTSSESHPFYTGTQKSVDNMGGRVEKFRNRFGKSAAK
jgi:large subunit ribosomal protein L31